VLNCALRAVLGEGVDQRGSVVLPDKLRFDYAISKAPTVEQLARVEALVCAAIDKALPVHTLVVPLKEAHKINGLRAVFGEVYPDPVRVVSVGATVEALLADPGNAAWRDISIEFCGGTHISNTSRAGAFALMADEALAKGIRRITGFTRDGATAAFGRSKELEGEFAVARSLGGAALEAAVVKLKQDVDAAAIPAVVKAALREQHNDLSRRVLAEQKAAAAALAEAGKAAVLAAAGAAAGAGAPFFVARVDQIGADGKAAQAVMEAVKKAHPALSFLAVSVGAGAAGEEVKVLAFAQVAEAHRPGKTAKDWIGAVMAAGDGKGGGRDDTAQGTTKDPSKIPAMEAAAAAYFSK